MSTTFARPLIADLRQPLTALRSNWLWFVLLGVGLIVLGIISLGAIPIASLATSMAIGVLLLTSGVAEIAGVFWCRGWTGFLLYLLSGVLSIVVGGLFLGAPVDALLALTLLLACMLVVGGVFKIVASLYYRFGAWGWALAGGVIDFVLGLMIWQDWPVSAFWVLGMYVGISLLFRGFNWIGLGLTFRTLPGTAMA